ncbi:MAG: helix-turn-helix transcriptional regulator [bacterium]
MELTKRQEYIMELVKRDGPITGEQIAETLHVTRSALRTDLAVLTMAGILDARPRVGYYYVGKVMGSFVGNTLKNIRVEDFQSVPSIVKEDDPVSEAVTKMFLEDVGTIFVVNEHNALVGVVSRKDCLKLALGQGVFSSTPVTVIMTRMPNIIMTTPDEDIFSAARKIIDHQIDCLPVVKPLAAEKEEWEVYGRLTKTNLTKLLLELGEE